MIKKFGLTFGGLHQKIVNVVLLFVIAIVIGYVSVMIYQARNLTKIVKETDVQQQASLQTITDSSTDNVLRTFMVNLTEMEAQNVNALFDEVCGDVTVLQTAAQDLFAHADAYSAGQVHYPDPAKNGSVSVQFLHSEGVDVKKSDTPGLIANLGQLMTVVYTSSDCIDGCYIGTPDGMLLYVNDRSGEYVDENGKPMETLNVTDRDWYRGAAETGALYVTGIIEDASTELPTLSCAAPVYSGGKLVAVVGADIFLSSLIEYMDHTKAYGGFACIVDENGELLLSSQMQDGETLDTGKLAPEELASLQAFVSRSLKENTDLTTLNIGDHAYYLAGVPIEKLGWAVISGIDRDVTREPLTRMLAENDAINADARAAFQTGVTHSQQTMLILTVVLLALAVITASAVATRIVKPVEHMTRQIADIRSSDFRFEMEPIYRTKDEVEVLAEAFEDLSERMKQYVEEITSITKEKERISMELELAQKIQANMLPNIFPPFPDRPEFEIYASMSPAKEVGGDFYDFFLIDENHLGIVMADVSGKGVPAALFMMMAKILVNNFANLGGSPAQVLERTNAALCKNNAYRMFVTIWLGVMEISTGRITAANAGHEYPILRGADGCFELFKEKHGFVLGSIRGMKYKDYEFTLEPGMTLFLYTDGVPESTNADGEMFGIDRLLKTLNQSPDAAPPQLIGNIHAALNAFVGEAAQFDDTTMLALHIPKPQDQAQN